jgi:hypothetical protein
MVRNHKQSYVDPRGFSLDPEQLYGISNNLMWILGLSLDYGSLVCSKLNLR